MKKGGLLLLDSPLEMYVFSWGSRSENGSFGLYIQQIRNSIPHPPFMAFVLQLLLFVRLARSATTKKFANNPTNIIECTVADQPTFDNL